MNHVEAARLLDRLAAGVPAGSVPPIAELVAAGERGRRRRTTGAVAAVMVAVLVVAGGGITARALAGGLQPSGEATHQTRPDPAGPTPTASPGMQLVGRGRVVLEVPDTWATVSDSCSAPAQAYVRIGPEPSCPVSRGGQRSHGGPVLTRTSVALTGLRGDEAGLDPARTTDGTQTLSFACRQGGSCLLRLAVPAEATLVVIATQGRYASSLAERVAATVTLLPAGFTTVPAVEDALTEATVTAAFDRVGLTAEIGELRPIRGVVMDPAVGTVVAVGSRVSVASPRPYVAPAGQVVTEPDQALLLGTWRPDELDGSPVEAAAPAAAVRLGFAGGVWTVRAGCFTAGATYTVDGKAQFASTPLTISPVDCPWRRSDEEGGRQVAAAMSAAAMVFLDPRGRLLLQDAERTVRASFERVSGPATGPVVDVDQVVGRWSPRQVLGRSFDPTTDGPQGSLSLLEYDGPDPYRFGVTDGCDYDDGDFTLDAAGGPGSFALGRSRHTHSVGCRAVPGLDNLGALDRTSSLELTPDGLLVLRDDRGAELATYQRYYG